MRRSIQAIYWFRPEGEMNANRLRGLPWETTALVGSCRPDSNIGFDTRVRNSRDPSDNPESAPLKQVADVPLPGPAVRFDYQSLDASHGRLYIAHMDADQLVVFDTKKREVVANLDGFPNVHGVWAVPELGRVYASATGEHKVAIVDMETLKTIAKAGPVQYPDGIAYAPGAKRVFVSDEHGNADAVIDATTNSLVTTIPLDGGAGNTVYDSGSGHILVAVHEKNELVAIDPAIAKIIGRSAPDECAGLHDPESFLPSSDDFHVERVPSCGKVVKTSRASQPPR